MNTERSIEIEAPAEKAWAVLGRFMHIDEFHPRITKVDVLTPALATGLGASRRCHFKDGSSVVEKVIDWQEGRSYRAELSGFSLPLNTAVTTLSIDPLGPGRARLTMSMEYQVKYGPLGWLMGKTMMARMMGGLFLVVLRGLEERTIKGALSAAS